MDRHPPGYREEVDLTRPQARLPEPQHGAARAHAHKCRCQARAADRLQRDVERPAGVFDGLDDLGGTEGTQPLAAPGGTGDCSDLRALSSGQLDSIVADPPDAPVISTRRLASGPAARSKRIAVNPASGSVTAVTAGTSWGSTASDSVATGTRGAQPPSQA